MITHTGHLDNPTYIAGTSSLEPTTSQPSQDEDTLASDYLEPVTTLPVLLNESEKIEATSRHTSKAGDQPNYFELNQVACQKSDIVHEQKSADASEEERSENHEHAILDKDTEKE